jgi:hypothetical protein
MYMRLSISHWLQVHTNTSLQLNVSLYDRDTPGSDPIIRLERVLDNSIALHTLQNYLLAIVASVCSGQPLHIIRYHCHSTGQPLPNLPPHILPPFIDTSITDSPDTDSDTDYEFLIPHSPSSHYSRRHPSSSTTSLTSLSSHGTN